MKSLSMETPVYYDDGKSLIGVFFENEHRIYIKYEDIPKEFVNALIAGEDKKFFKHHGIDMLSILRAAYVNFQAKRIIQGGSTLTQQTAKNLFKRSGRTFATKLKELMQALKLEAHYSKEEIIEFFTNQFYVSGTGRGLAIAAKYFFDKPVDKLTLLECAFIAGSVRAPNRYNPLVQPTPERKSETLNRANARKKYVLHNMLKLGMISPATYTELVQAPIPFKEGRVFYQLNVIMDYIREQLQSQKFQGIFASHGISNIATSGIKIYTTINRDLQNASVRILRKHLSQLETMLNGYDRNAIQSRYAQIEIPEVKEPEVGQFVFGQVEGKSEEGDKTALLVRVGDMLGKVDHEGLMNVVTPYKKFKSGTWAIPSLNDGKELLSQVNVGDLVYVYVKGKSQEDDLLLLELEQKPRLEGGLIVAKKGKILAMVGGFDNIYFNRAVDGKRQMGSIFKPIVYTAALQLGWNPLDPLENRRDVFVFQNQYYFPRPDHESPYDNVSLAWAGVKSENVASVWLLYHLCDKLSFPQFHKIAQLVDLAPRGQENYSDFQRRIRDSWGIIVTEEDLREAGFQTAKEELITDLIFAGKTKEAEALKLLHYGIRFDESRATLTQDSVEELAIMDRLLRKHFLRYHRLNLQMIKEWEYLKNVFHASVPDYTTVVGLLAHFYTGFCDGQAVIAYGEDLGGKGFVPLRFDQAFELFQGEHQTSTFSPLSSEEILIEGEISSLALSNLHQSIDNELNKLKSHPPYDMTTLWKIRDYRILVGLLYVVKLCKTMGIETHLEPVLSFPLGPNAVSLLEILQAFATLTEGKRYATDSFFSPASFFVIDRITDAEGAELYRYLPQETQIVDPRIVTMVNEVLKNVVQYGTGNKAKNAVTLKVDLGIKTKELIVTVPTLGKTGTANEYSNSSYIGFIPAFSEKGTDFSIKNSFVVATYVGYDDNTPMKNSRIRIFGASGALPIWIDVANEVVKNPIFQQAVDPIDFAFLPEDHLSLSQPSGTIAVPVDEGNGLVLSLDRYLEGLEPVATIYSYGQREGKLFKPQRVFAPIVTKPDNHIF